MSRMINLWMKLQQKVTSCGSRMQKQTNKHRGSLGESDRRGPHFTKKVGSLGDSRDNQQKMGSLGDSSTENRGTLEPYICVTSIMVVPPGPYLFEA